MEQAAKIFNKRATNICFNFAGKKCIQNQIRETCWKVTIRDPQKEKRVLLTERNHEVKKYLELSSVRFQLCALVLSAFSFFYSVGKVLVGITSWRVCCIFLKLDRA
jgi:hypothetical protein